MTEQQVEVVQLDMGIAQPSWKMADVPLDDIAPNEFILAPAPERGFIADIQRRGLVTPVALCYAPEGAGYVYEIIAGRRRVMAFRALRAAGMARFDVIPAIVYETISDYEAALMASSENNKRTANKLQDVVAIKKALEQTGADPKTKEGLALLAKETGIAINTLKKRLKLAMVERGFIQAVVDGKVPVGALDTLAQLSPKMRAPLLAKLQNSGKLTSKDVEEAKATQVADRLAQSPVSQMLPGFDDLPEPEMPSEWASQTGELDFGLDLSDEHVRILNAVGEVVVGWDKHEWVEDASVVPAICNAIRMVYEEGVDALLAALAEE